MAKFKNKNNLDCCGDTTRGLFSAHPARSPHSEGPIFQSAFLWVQMQLSREEMTGPDQNEQHNLRGNLPRGCLTSGPPHKHNASQLSSNTTHLPTEVLLHESPGTILSFLPAMLHSQLFCTKMELLGITFPSSPHPDSRTPTDVELGPMTIS